MPRTPPFTFASFALHFQAPMAKANPVETEIPRAMEDLLARLGQTGEVSLSSRLRGLKALFDEEGFGGEAAGLA